MLFKIWKLLVWIVVMWWEGFACSKPQMLVVWDKWSDRSKNVWEKIKGSSLGMNLLGQYLHSELSFYYNLNYKENL